MDAISVALALAAFALCFLAIKGLDRI